MKKNISKQEIRELRSRLSDASAVIDALKVELMKSANYDKALAQWAGDCSRASMDIIGRTEA